jgi:outer membrane protein assembly factor BamA
MPKIKHLFTSLLFLLYFSNTLGQNLYLTCFGSSENETKSIDSLGYKNMFEDYSSLETEVSNLKKTLIKVGYIEIEQLHLIKRNDSSYDAHFSLRNKYNSITISHNNLVDLPILKSTGFLDTSNDLIIPIENIESTLEFINSQLANKGNPFSSLILTDIISIDHSYLKGSLSVSELNTRTMDKLVLKGYEKFPKSFIKRYLKIKTNQTFSLEKIKEKTKALNDLAFANQIRDPEVLFTKDSTILYMYLEKAKSNTFDGFLGFGTNEATNKIEFDGYLNLNLTNNLNYGESLKLLYKSDESDQQTFDLELDAPYILNTPIGVI